MLSQPAEPASTAFLVDDDEQLRRSLEVLVRQSGLAARGFVSAEDFLAKVDARQPGCLVLDLKMPGMSGLDLLDQLRRSGYTLPVILVTGFADVPTAVRAIKQGAIDVVEKPYDPDDLLDRIRAMIDSDRQQRFTGSRMSTRLASLSGRQREVMQLLLAGKSTKEIAVDLNISPKTVEKHRAGLLVKMRADSVVDLMRKVLMTS